MRIVFSLTSWEQFEYWLKHDKKMVIKINKLIKDISRTPFEGIGKPEPLKHQYQGYWSRKIDDEHRLIYSFSDEDIYIISCRFHYNN